MRKIPLFFIFLVILGALGSFFLLKNDLVNNQVDEAKHIELPIDSLPTSTVSSGLFRLQRRTDILDLHTQQFEKTQASILRRLRRLENK